MKFIYISGDFSDINSDSEEDESDQSGEEISDDDEDDDDNDDEQQGFKDENKEWLKLSKKKSAKSELIPVRFHTSFDISYKKEIFVLSIVHLCLYITNHG